MSHIEQNTEVLVMDSNIHKELPALFSMAHDRSESGRVSLIQKIAEIFLSPAASLSSSEEDLVNQLISDLLQNSTVTVRQSLITEFARAVDAPRTVAMRIAGGPIEIARPALAANQNLMDDDLITLIKDNSTDHAAAIASRQKINEVVADALIATGDVGIMQIVAENMGAKLSSRAIEVMVDAARLASLLQKPIMSRPELNPESAMRLYWWVSQDLRRATLDRYGFGPGKLDAALTKATEDVLSALMLQKEDDSAMGHLADWLQERGAMTTKLLPYLLRVGHFRLFNIALSRLSHLDLATIDLINSASGARMMVVLCRAIEIEKGNFVSIFLMARGGRKDDQVVHPRELSQAIDTYDKLSPDMAKAILERWRMDPSDVYERAASSALAAQA